jgi:predicted CxxxxCH...CXXCH cytochrome family protein
MNGVVDATSQHPAGWAAKEQHGYAANRQGLASCTGCHGTDFNGGTTGVSCNACHTSAGWAAWQTNCTFCHGTRVATYTSASLRSAAPPVGSEGETAATTRAVGAHQRHLAGGTIGPAVACATCHAVPGDLAHVNGTATVNLNGPAALDGVTPSWNGATCATYCHGASLGGGAIPAPTWTAGSTQIACGACHGLPPPAPHTTSTSCGTCHTGYTSTSVNLSLHLNGTVDATSQHPAGWAAKAQHGYSANRSGLTSCKGCHGANLDGVGGTGPSCTACHSSAGFAGWATSCTFCHGNRTSGLASPPVDTQGGSATTNVSVGTHANHLGTTLMATPACTACHPNRTGSNVITDAAHIDGNGIAEIAFGGIATTGGTRPTYTRASATSASCAATYCHGGYTGGAAATMSWTSTTQVSCTSCHGLPPSTGRHGNHSSRDCGDCHPGYTRTSVNQATHINGTKQVGNRVTSWNPTTRQCVGCHGSDTW